MHTRNFGTLDCLLVAAMLRVPVRIHGEHGWDIFDPDGTRRKYRWVRRCMAPFVHQFYTVSKDLQKWLVRVVGISAGKVRQICNGVDTETIQASACGV